MRNFINWKLVPGKKKPGDTKEPKPIKLPISAATGRAIDHMDPATWMTLEEAQATGHPVGVMISPPYFVVDLDSHWDGSNWSQFATGICARFPGAAIEVSHSGKGLHIFGRYEGPFPPHRTRPKDRLAQPGLEFYTKKRFIALGTNMTGSWDSIHTGEALKLAESLGPPPATGDAAGWTNGPAEEWRGPESDEELIAAMLRAKSSGQVALGLKISLPDLWNGDPDILEKFMPDPNRDDEITYDANAVDAALCTHLAFWTGKDCERIDRLVRASGIMRDKWDDRPDYVERTILGAVSLCSAVYQCREVAEVSAPMQGATVSTDVRAEERVGYQLLTTSQQLDYFAGCVYIRDANRVLVPDGGLLKQSQFEVIYGGYFFVVDGDANTSKSAWEAFTGSRVNTVIWAHRIAFRPEEPVGAIITEEGSTWVNTYVPIETRRLEGDAGPFLRHVDKLFPDAGDRDIILAFMAAVVQHPGIKFQWCPVIQGMEGNGKTLFTRVLLKAVGERYSRIIKPKSLTNNFNGWVNGTLFLGVEEIRVGNRRDIMDEMKDLVTNEKVEIEFKGVDSFLGDNRANIILNSNWHDAVFKSTTDRRYGVFFTPQQDEGDLEAWGMGPDYFRDLYAWLKADGYAIVTNWLHEYEIAEELNPAHGWRAPKTTSTAAAIEASYGPIEQEILEAIRSDMPGFKGGWISSAALTKLLDAKHHKLSYAKRKDSLKSLGFITHPKLEEGRSKTIIIQDGTARPVLYVKKGSLNLNLLDPTAAYIKAQGYSTTEAANAAAQN